MITAQFQSKDGRFRLLVVSGHAEYDDVGQDIVCAAVTSAVQLVANGITEILAAEASAEAEENRITLAVPQDETQTGEQTEAFLRALKLHLELLAEQFPGTIEIQMLEV